MFIAAVSYVAYETLNRRKEISELNPEILDSACQLISSHYKEGCLQYAKSYWRIRSTLRC